MSAFVEFNRGIMRMPLPWRLWLMLLVAANLAVPLFFLGHREAQFVLGAMMVGMALMTILTDRFGFTRILGRPFCRKFLPTTAQSDLAPRRLKRPIRRGRASYSPW